MFYYKVRFLGFRGDFLFWEGSLMRATYLSSLISAFSKSRALEKNDFPLGSIFLNTHTP